MTRETKAIRKHFIAALGAATLASAAAAPAQTYPSRPVEFIVHVNPGGGTDVFARLVTEIMRGKRSSRSRSSCRAARAAAARSRSTTSRAGAATRTPCSPSRPARS